LHGCKDIILINKDYAYDTFITLKEEALNRHEETHRKYMYALNLRFEAAEHIGIENIRNHKLAQLTNEKENARIEYENGKMLCPEFKPILIVKMAGRSLRELLAQASREGGND